MALPKRLIAEIFAGLGRAVERDDLELLRQVHGILEAAHPGKKSARSISQMELGLSQHVAALRGKARAASELREEFSRFETREALSAHLRERYPKKTDIVGVAREIRIPVIKDENYDGLLEKVIDAAIGYKIRSRAIRGETDAPEG
jgi:hypothetical protein